MKSIAVLNFADLNPSEKVIKANSIVTALTGNPDFDKPKPTLADITAAVGDLNAAQQAVENNGGGKKWVNARNEKEKALDLMMAELTNFINNNSNGDSDSILGAGFDLKKPPVRRSKPDAPQNVVAKALGEGKAKISYDKVAGAVSYHGQQSADVSPFVWQEFAGNIATSTKMEVQNLPGGDKIWFRVIAINSAGEGEPSDPAVVRVP